MVKYDWAKLTAWELKYLDEWEQPEYVNWIVKKTEFSIKTAVKMVTEQRKFNKQSQFSNVKPISLMLDKLDILDKDEKIEMCKNLLFAQFHIQMLDYRTIDLINDSSTRKLLYLMYSYGVPDDIFEDIYEIFIEKILYEQKKLR